MAKSLTPQLEESESQDSRGELHKGQLSVSVKGGKLKSPAPMSVSLLRCRRGRATACQAHLPSPRPALRDFLLLAYFRFGGQQVCPGVH